MNESTRLSVSSKTSFGFWVYIMTDCVLFASLFAVYAVQRHATSGGPGGKDLFSLPFILVETLILLTSSLTVGLSMVAAHKNNAKQTLMLLLITYLLGLSFLVMEVTEFRHLALEGNSWARSGFLSALFTIVGTHGLHIFVGLIWMKVLMLKIWRKRSINVSDLRRLSLLAMFWHFLDIIWIFIFSIVYLVGAL